MAANFAKLLGLVRGTVEAAGQRLFAFHFPEHTRSHVPILCLFPQFGSAGVDRQLAHSSQCRRRRGRRAAAARGADCRLSCGLCRAANAGDQAKAAGRGVMPT
jgi:hypothetical protein